jgi:predicted transcriptional regulator of viral defense system
MNNKLNINVSSWVENLEKRGRNSFSLIQLEEELPNYSEIAVKSALRRLSKKGKVVSIHKGFYLIISVPYANRGILPAALFMDRFMNYLQRPYYVGLLSAAALYGASHQQPQEYFVVTDFPVLRPSHKKGQKVKKTIERRLLKERKTESGYVKVSSPALTASDLVQFEKRSGGLTRVATILDELISEIDPKEFNSVYFKATPTTVVQKLGYLIEKVIRNENMADKLFKASKENQLDFYRIPLKPSASLKGFLSDNRWKVIANIRIEMDE